MKFSQAHVQILKDRMLPLINDKVIDSYQSGKFRGAEKVKDLNKRFRWDVFYASGTRIGDGVGISSNCGIEGDYNDIHIDTALRSFIPKIERKY